MNYEYKIGDYIMYDNDSYIYQITWLEEFEHGRSDDEYFGEGKIIAKYMNNIISKNDKRYTECCYLSLKNNKLISEELLNQLNKFLTFQ